MKLNGLPGLIIDAYDEKKEVWFQFAGMENISATTKSLNTPSTGPKVIDLDVSLVRDTEIQLPTNAIRTTQKELDKLKMSRDKDPQGFRNAQMAAANGSYSLKAQPKATVDPLKKNIINNPIELPEHKN